jgi:hypothetical protein
VSQSDPTQLAIPRGVAITRPAASLFVLNAARRASLDTAAIARCAAERAIRARSRKQLLVVVERAGRK